MSLIRAILEEMSSERGGGAGRGRGAGRVRDWAVSGGLVFREDRLLLVRNRRRNDSVEWSTPGGVVDPGETFLEALGREVQEETGIFVNRWDGPQYEITVDFTDLAWRLRVEAHRAVDWQGDIVLEDPDGIVEHADFYDLNECEAHLVHSPRWVREPLLEWCHQRPPEKLCFHYQVTGTDIGDLTVAHR